ncbi:MAG TPA: TetR/AcrR family transcriptional regulator [Nocardioidaceae bacterium]|nr:TetR/AcrR family transcriptional regulator [Nocardioidaceae bacterium]
MKSTRSYDMTARSESSASTRDRIVRAGAELLMHRSYEDVTLATIAHTAGVSHQTVLNHFGSKEGVAGAVADVLRSEMDGLRGRAVPGDVRGAVRIVVEQYEQFGDSNVRWAMSAERLGSLASRIDEARAYHQDWLGWVFADDLPSGKAQRRRAVNALHAATDVYTWKLLRRDLGLSRRETENTMAGLVSGVLRGMS